MFKKNLAALFVLFSAFFIFGSAAHAQETEAADESKLLQIMLPQSAQRVLPQSVLAEVSRTFDKVITAGGGKLRQGETEVLIFGGHGYKKANAAGIVNRFTSAVKNAGWKYAIEGEENGVTLFSAVQESPRRRGIVGFYGASDDAMILAAMEIIPNYAAATIETSDAQTKPSAPTEQPEKTPIKKSSGGGGSVVGSWYDGYSSIWSGYSPTTGPKSFTPGRSHYFKYVFHPNGTFEFTGLMQTAVYSCTTQIFNDQRGTYKINGDQITLTKTKNFFRRMDSCSAANFLEKHHTLGSETYTFSVNRSDRGKEQVCFKSEEGTPCYERE